MVSEALITRPASQWRAPGGRASRRSAFVANPLELSKQPRFDGAGWAEHPDPVDYAFGQQNGGRCHRAQSFAGAVAKSRNTPIDRATVRAAESQRPQRCRSSSFVSKFSFANWRRSV